MAFVFHRRLAIPLWAIALFTVVLTVPPPSASFQMPPATLFVMAAVGLAAIVLLMPGANLWWRTSRVLARVRPSGQRDHGGGARSGVRPLAPTRSEAEDALALVRMDDDGGFQMTRRPA